MEWIGLGCATMLKYQVSNCSLLQTAEVKPLLPSCMDLTKLKQGYLTRFDLVLKLKRKFLCPLPHVDLGSQTNNTNGEVCLFMS